MTPTTGFKETMKVVDVVNYFMNNRKQMSATILFFMAASANRDVCDADGNMDAAFICKSLMVGGDNPYTLFRELQTKVTTYVSWS